VSCPTTTSCVAVGLAVADGTAKPISLVLTSTHWSLKTVPDTGGAGEPTSLAAIDCASAASCVAAGGSTDSSGATGTAVIDHWDGTSWATRTVDQPSAPVAAFTGIDCGSTSACDAVGSVTEASSHDTDVLVEQGPPT
jgi:hypothetical protein